MFIFKLILQAEKFIEVLHGIVYQDTLVATYLQNNVSNKWYKSKI